MASHLPEIVCKIVDQSDSISRYLGMGKGREILNDYRKWHAAELSKIILNARLIGVVVCYKSSEAGKLIGLQDGNADVEFSGKCEIIHNPLMGSLFFSGELRFILKHVRLPGINAEYRNYEERPGEIYTVNNEFGQSVGRSTFGSSVVEVAHYAPEHRI